MHALVQNNIGVVSFLATKGLNHYKMPTQILDML